MTLIRRLAHAELYDLGGRRRRLLAGGSIRNVVPFDEGGALTPAELLIASADKVAADRYRLRKNGVGIEVDLAAGDIAVNAVPGWWGDKRIVFRTGVPLRWRQLRERYVELWHDTRYVRYSFILWDRGFKFNFFLKPGYSGTGEFRVPYLLQGLYRDGRELKETGSGITCLHLRDPHIIPLKNYGVGPVEMDPHEQQALGIPAACTEQDQGGEFIVQADLTGFGSLYTSCYIDPQITFDTTGTWLDAPLQQYYPHNNMGAGPNWWSCSWYLTSNHHNKLTVAEIDTTALPDGASIDSALLRRHVYHGGTTEPSGFTQVICILRESFVEGTRPSWNSGSQSGSCDFIDRRHGYAMPWSSGMTQQMNSLPTNDGLSFGAEVMRATPPEYRERDPDLYAGGTATWHAHEIKDAVQYAVDNSLPTRLAWTVEPWNSGPRYDWYYHGKDSPYPAKRPYLDVTYNEGAGDKSRFPLAGAGRRRSFSAVPESQAIGTMRRVYHG
jgi:hypothetical protein